MITCYACNKTVKKVQFSPKAIHHLKKCTFWLDFENPSHKDLKPLEKLFGIHHLVIEDCLVPQERRPKITQYKNVLHVVAYASSNPHSPHLKPVHFILGKNFIISMHKTKMSEFDSVKKNKEELNRVMKGTADQILYALIDRIVDNYFPMLDVLGDELDVLEDKIIKDPQDKHLEKLFAVKRNALRAKKIMGPQRDVISHLAKTSNGFISEKTSVYFRDVYDHLIWINDQLDSARDTISSILEIQISVTSNKMNEVMKVLTVFASIMLPLTVIGSIYGMNFKYMPELYWRYGYAGVWGVMILVVVVMIYWFKRKGWV